MSTVSWISTPSGRMGQSLRFGPLGGHPCAFVCCKVGHSYGFSGASFCRHSFIPQHPSHLQVIIDIRYQYAIMGSLGRHDPSACPPQLWRSQIPALSERRVPANYARPPDSPSNFFKISSSHPITFSPTLRPRKSFSGNTYGLPRKCCKQKTYGRAKSFICNTYKKQGGGGCYG